MASEQISVTKAEPDDTEIFGWNVKKLKEYISRNSSTNTSNIKDKQRLRFIAIDCKDWTIDRIEKLDPKYRGFFIEKINSYIKKSEDIESFLTLTKTFTEIYINPKPNETEKRQQIIAELLQMLPPKQNINDIQPRNQNEIENNGLSERALVLPSDNNNDSDHESDDDMSSVSTHSSMPSLMSDDESDESDDDEEETDSEEDDDALIGLETDAKSDAMKAIKPPNHSNGKKKPKKTDDFLSGMQSAFLNSGKKKQSKKKEKNKNKKANKRKNANPNAKEKQVGKKKEIQKNKITANQKKNANQNVKKKANQNAKEKEKEVEVEKKEDVLTEIGLYLQPLQVDAFKNAKGNMFICIGSSKVAADLSEYQYLKCWVSLKNKLRRKGKKKAFHNSVLLDLKKKNEMHREIARETLMMGFENVLSFELNPKHFMLDVTEKNMNGQRVNIETAFKEYQENDVLINEKFYVEKLIIEQKADEIMEKKVDQSPKESNKNKNNNKKNSKQSNKNERNNNNKNKKNIKNSDKSDNKSDKNGKQSNKTDKNNNDNKKNSKQSNKTDNYKNVDASHLTIVSLNDCRLRHFDICMLINDDSMRESISDNNFYVRVRFGRDYRIGRIENIMDYPSKYKFIDNIYTTKGFTIRLNKKKILNKKFTQISNDDFTAKEIDLWLKKMRKEKTQIPVKKELIIAAETLDIIRINKKRMQSQKEKEKEENENNNNVIEPGSAPPGFVGSTHNDANIAPLNAETLAQLNDVAPSAYKPNLNAYLQHYLAVIQRGFVCFWCIPSKADDEDSVYIALLLAKSSKNDPILAAAESYAQKLSADIRFAEIRETTEKKNSSDFWKAKGRLFDCGNTQNAWNLYAEIDKNLLPRSYGRKYQTNFVRYVDAEFGAAFLRMQSLPKNEKPKLSKELRVKPHGPKVNYTCKAGEPSFATISEIAPADCIQIGEASVVGDDEDTRSHVSGMTNKTVSKYDAVYNQLRQNLGFHVDDRVLYEGQEYEVIHVGKDGNIRIENDQHSAFVPSYVLSKI